MPPAGEHHIEDDPLWYKDAIVYQVHVRAFHDASGDGHGDFAGLTKSLDYIQELGVTAVWLMPFYPSPLRDDGYDISDYTKVHPSYGTMAEFRRFQREAHRRGIRVITELVVNHTSDQHPWFQRARNAPAGSRRRNFYVWSDTPKRYSDVRIIFPDFESSNWTWDPVAQQYFWHRFYSHQPDLNFDNPDVHRAVLRALDFWLDMGVDGLRLDAIPYLYERDGTNCENLPETHSYLQNLRLHVDGNYKNRMLLAEANQWPEDASAYFGDGDECHMAFHFPLMPRLFMAIHQGDRYPIIDILQETPDIPESAQWAMFLRNHDELTLEMVTDEERDYMYRSYARDQQARVNLGIRRRLAPLLGNDRRKIELMNGLLMSLPGTPIIYYGDELGMGDNIYLGDRDAVRTPMQWSGDRNAGFSSSNPQKLYLPVIVDPEYHYEAVNAEAQHQNPNSLLWWTRRLLRLRKRFRAFGRGTLEFLNPHNHRVLAYVREHEGECILVVANLSHHATYVELDLSRYKGMNPVELMGSSVFPPIGELPYLLTLGPYQFYWMSLEGARTEFGPTGAKTVPGRSVGVGGGRRDGVLPALRVTGEWRGILRGRAKTRLEAVLPAYLRSQRWFRGKARRIQAAEIRETVSVRGCDAVVLLVEVTYREGEPERYVLPLTFVAGERSERVVTDHAKALVAELIAGEHDGVLVDAFIEADFARALLDLVLTRRRWKGQSGDVWGFRTRRLRDLVDADMSLAPRVSEAEQSNTSVIYGNHLVLKLFRRLEEGLNPDLEIGRFLTETQQFPHVPAVAGAVDYGDSVEPSTLAVLQELVENEGDAWRFSLDDLDSYHERLLSASGEIAAIPPDGTGPLDLMGEAPPDPVQWLLDTYPERAELMGRRTAQLHVALGDAAELPDFRPEAFTQLHQRSLYQGMAGQVRSTLRLLRRSRERLDEESRVLAEEVLEGEATLLGALGRLRSGKIDANRIRCHGDLHLGQILYTGRDFVILDFEGEPGRPLTERRIKRCPLRDVAGMLRSFDYAGATALRNVVARGMTEPGSELHDLLTSWTRVWVQWAGASFLHGYFGVAGIAQHVPTHRTDVQTLLDAYVLEKATYEVTYELNNRPEWVGIPLQGVRALLERLDA